MSDVNLAKPLVVRVMVVDKPRHKGLRIYNREIIEKALEEVSSFIKAKRVFVTLKWSNSIAKLTDVIGITTKMELRNDDYVYATIQFLNTPAFRVFQECISRMSWLNIDDMFTTVALGNIQESYADGEPDSIMDDYEFIGISVSGLIKDFGGIEDENDIIGDANEDE